MIFYEQMKRLSMLKQMRFWLMLLVAFSWVGCATPLIPTPQQPTVSRSDQSDVALIESIRAEWNILKSSRSSEEERGAALDRYNEKLMTLVRRLRLDALQASDNDVDLNPKHVDLFYAGKRPDRPLRVVYDDMVPAEEIEPEELEERVTVRGLGVPIVGVIPAGKVEKSDRVVGFRDRGTVSTLTAVLRFPDSRTKKPQLHLVERLRTEAIPVGKHNYVLAADFSAPIEVYWSLTKVKDDRLLGMLQPQKLRDTMGLTCMERYNPNRIPVILTHGLMSSASTFNNLVNRLMAYPEIRNNYQFWYFNYPTGVAWTLTADEYRKALKEAREKLDPKKKNRNWEKMVVVGHSMGGLITRYSQCVEPWKMLEKAEGTFRRNKMKQYIRPEYVDKPLPAGLEPFRSDYFFRPVGAGMVVYLATPHRGAPMATYGIVNWLIRLVKLPQQLIGEVYNIATLQQDSLIMQPERMTEWFTSTRQLSPDSYSITGLQNLSVRPVPTHSIIGDRGRGDTPKSSDGVVPYWSSHIGWGTETIVPSDHSVQDVPETADRLSVILLDYLKENKAQKQPRRHRRAASAARSASL